MIGVLDFARDYIRRGWAVVPVPFKSKRPTGDAWQNLRITEADAHQWFNGEAQNVGVLMGGPSGGLVDIDLDCAEAIRAAGYFLPRTLCFGRPSKARSHWLYQSDLWQTEDKAAIQFKFATGKGKDRKEQMILELRIGGGGKAAQTVFPGSVHEKGELIAWDEKENIARAEGDSLKQRCARAASAALIAEHFPLKGARHDAGLTLGGFLLDAGLAARTRNCLPRPSRSQAASLSRKSKTLERRRARHGTKATGQAARRGGSRLSQRHSAMKSQSMLQIGWDTRASLSPRSCRRRAPKQTAPAAMTGRRPLCWTPRALKWR
jgi:hypothetical protein